MTTILKSKHKKTTKRKELSPILTKASRKNSKLKNPLEIGKYDPRSQQWTIRCGETYTYSQTTNYSSSGETNKDDKSTA